MPTISWIEASADDAAVLIAMGITFSVFHRGIYLNCVVPADQVDAVRAKWNCVLVGADELPGGDSKNGPPLPSP